MSFIGLQIDNINANNTNNFFIIFIFCKHTFVSIDMYQLNVIFAENFDNS